MYRRTNYEARPEIARMKSFNAEEGFYCFHIQWAIGKLPKNPDVCRILSEGFKTKDGGNHEWKLRVLIIGEENVYMNIQRNDDGKDIPVIARLKLMNETKGLIEFSSSAAFLLSDSDWLFEWMLPEEDAKKLSNTDNYIVHCYMDIPKKYDGTYTARSIQNGTALLSSSLASSFEKVISKNGDPTSAIELVIKDGSEDPPRFYCHRLIMATRSPVFETMFTNDRFKESNERIVEIEDMDGETLKLLLQYLYTGRIIERLQYASKRVMLSLLNAAEKYMLPELKDECVLALIGGGNHECNDAEWIDHLQLAEKFNLEYLRKVCIVALSTNMRSLRDQNIRCMVSPLALADLLDLVTLRGEFTKTVELHQCCLTFE